MPPVQTAKPDGAKIRELMKSRGFSGVTDFARAIGRPRQSIWNIVGYEPQTGLWFLHQIARGLGVRVSDISDWAGDDDTGPEPEVLASLDAKQGPGRRKRPGPTSGITAHTVPNDTKG